jgi:hypothetical protein
VYQQTQGISHKFPGSGLSIEQQAKNVLAFRQANKQERATIEEVIQDIDEQTCLRLGCLPQFCYDTDKPFSAPPTVAKKGGCGSCGLKA